MAVKIFAAIVIGSSETEMRIYEYTSRRAMKEIDCISTRLNLGVDAYTKGRLDPEKVEQLCHILTSFRQTMDAYQAAGYRCVATSALRETRSSDITRDYIEKQTGLKIEIISNSEQRFLDYKSIACESASFEKIIQNGTAIVDIGGSSMQVSFFDKDKLVTTANMRVGKITTREHYIGVSKNHLHYASLIRDVLNHEMAGFSKLYQKDKPTKNLIIVDPEITDLLRHQKGSLDYFEETENGEVFCMTVENFNGLYDRVLEMKNDEISEHFEITADAATLVLQSLIFCRCLQEATGAQILWLMDVTICDGLAYDYGVRNKLIRQTHNFEEDILAAARNIAKRYKASSAHIRNMEELCLGIFNKTKKIHGMKSRERLLLQISAMLHNCGKYISLTNVSDCAYNIIMATEIIGLSHNERRIIANVVKFNNAQFLYYDEWNEPGLSLEEYLTVAKLTAILRVANALDRSHKQKFSDEGISLKDDRLVFAVSAAEDVTLERVTLEEKAEFFEEVLNVHPVIEVKKNFPGRSALKNKAGGQ